MNCKEASDHPSPQLSVYFTIKVGCNESQMISSTQKVAKMLVDKNEVPAIFSASKVPLGW